MRTTIDINDDLMRELKSRAQSTGLSLKEVINSTLRHGMKAERRHAPGRPYQCAAFSLGAPATYTIDKSLEIAGELVSEEIARKLRLRK